MEDYSRQRHEEAGLPLRELAAHLEGPPVRDVGPPGVVRRRACSRRWSSTTGASAYYLKPMNCPFHILIYRSHMRSYRELPLRLFEFGTVYRYEKSGVVHGLTRVRGLTQDDAHIFCTKEQLAEELGSRSSSCSTCCATTASTTSTSSCRRSRREGGRHRRGVGRGHRGPARGAAAARISSSCSTRAAARSTGRRSRCRRATRSAARGRCRRSSSTSRSRSGSSSSTSAPTTSATVRS